MAKPNHAANALKGLLACDGVPIPEEALIAHLQNAARPGRPGVAELEMALKQIENDRYADVNEDALTKERTWTLTDKGTHKARQL